MSFSLFTSLLGSAPLKYLSLIVLLVLAGIVALPAEIPMGYYSSAEGLAGEELREALHNIVRNHKVVPYSSSQADTSDALKILDQTHTNSNYIRLIYSGSNVLASTFGTGWNREHQWPNSYGLDDVHPAYSDLHNLRACDANVNSARGNKFFDRSDTNSAGFRNPAHAEAALSTTDSDSWEPAVFDRGDIARALFYMAIRYTGDKTNEPALILTDDTALISATNAYMGKLSTLLLWHHNDPVDAHERLRNDRVYSLYQTNRNPFIDHPEWVNLTFAPAHTNPPMLLFTRVLNGITVEWLATNQSASLEYTTNLTMGWVSVPVQPILDIHHFYVTVTNVGTMLFFRLRGL